MMSRRRRRRSTKRRRRRSTTSRRKRRRGRKSKKRSKKRSKKKNRFPSSSGRLGRSKSQIESDVEEDRRSERRNEKKAEDIFKAAGASALIFTGFVLQKKYADRKKFKPPFIVVEKNGIKGYYDKQKKWYPRPQTVAGYNVWKKYRKSHVKFLDEFIYNFQNKK